METVDQLVWWVLSGVLGVLALIIRYTVARLITKLDQLVKVVEGLTQQNAVVNTVIRNLNRVSLDHESRLRNLEKKKP